MSEMRSTPDAAIHLVLALHPSGDVLCIGHLHDDGNDMPPYAGHTVCVDLGGRGQDIRVYEILFEKDGEGFLMEVAATLHLATFEQTPFKFDLVDGMIVLKGELTPDPDEAAIGTTSLSRTTDPEEIDRDA